VLPPFEGPLKDASSVALLETTIYPSQVVFAKVHCCSLDRLRRVVLLCDESRPVVTLSNQLARAGPVHRLSLTVCLFVPI